MKTLSRTQIAALEELQRISFEMTPKLPEMRAAAIGGLTQGEEIALIGARQDGQYLSSHERVKRIPGMTWRTLNSLYERGAIGYRNGTWFAYGTSLLCRDGTPRREAA